MAKTFFEQGNNNITSLEGNRVYKKKKPGGASMTERSYPQQMKLWNQYYQDTEYATASISEDGRLSTPYIKGRYPNDEERLKICEAMHARGFIMTDCRDPRNFLVQDNHIYPIDFGQIYKQGETFYKAHEAIFLKTMQQIRNELQTIHPIPHKNNAYKKLEDSITDLKEYQNKLTSSDDLTQNKLSTIALFIKDTEDRLQKHKMGHQNAFDDYIEKNKDAINVLHQNRETNPKLKSILLAICTGIVPGLLVGLIQWIATKGNSFLFTHRKTQSEQRALAIQKEIKALQQMNPSSEEERKNETLQHIK